MRPWLIELLDNGSVPGLAWVNRQENVFKINWKHGSRHGYNAIRDATLFEKYAELTGRKDPKRSNPKKWKANFRCALNSLKDVEEMKNEGSTKGHNAFRVYRFLDAPRTKKRKHSKCQQDEVTPSPRKRKYRRHERETMESPSTEESCSASSIADELTLSSPPDISYSVVEKEYSSIEPGVSRHIFQNHMCGCLVIQKDSKKATLEASVIDTLQSVRPNSSQGIEAEDLGYPVSKRQRTYLETGEEFQQLHSSPEHSESAESHESFLDQSSPERESYDQSDVEMDNYTNSPYVACDMDEVAGNIGREEEVETDSSEITTYNILQKFVKGMAQDSRQGKRRTRSNNNQCLQEHGNCPSALINSVMELK